MCGVGYCRCYEQYRYIFPKFIYYGIPLILLGSSVAIYQTIKLKNERNLHATLQKNQPHIAVDYKVNFPLGVENVHRDPLIANNCIQLRQYKDDLLDNFWNYYYEPLYLSSANYYDLIYDLINIGTNNRPESYAVAMAAAIKTIVSKKKFDDEKKCSQTTIDDIKNMVYVTDNKRLNPRSRVYQQLHSLTMECEFSGMRFDDLCKELVGIFEENVK